MWRRHAQKVSLAEDLIYRELHKQGLNKHLHRQVPFKFDVEKDGVAGTWADYYYAGPYQLTIFIDGPHHLKKKQEERDRLVVAALRRRGFYVKRIIYTPPPTKRRVAMVVSIIRQALKDRETAIRMDGGNEPFFFIAVKT